MNEKVVISIGLADIVKRVLTEIQDQETFAKTTDDNLVTAKRATRILAVTNNTLYRWEKNNYLLPVRIGSKRMYKFSDLEAILNGEKINPKNQSK